MYDPIRRRPREILSRLRGFLLFHHAQSMSERIGGDHPAESTDPVSFPRNLRDRRGQRHYEPLRSRHAGRTVYKKIMFFRSSEHGRPFFRSSAKRRDFKTGFHRSNRRSGLKSVVSSKKGKFDTAKIDEVSYLKIIFTLRAISSNYGKNFRFIVPQVFMGSTKRQWSKYSAFAFSHSFAKDM